MPSRLNVPRGVFPLLLIGSGLAAPLPNSGGPSEVLPVRVAEGARSLNGEWSFKYNPVTFDITDALRADEMENVLAVRVTTRSKGWEFDTNDCWALSGIYRDVTLLLLGNWIRRGLGREGFTRTESLFPALRPAGQAPGSAACEKLSARRLDALRGSLIRSSRPVGRRSAPASPPASAGRQANGASSLANQNLHPNNPP